MGHRLTIALDAMGGDHAPDIVLRGASKALQQRPELQFRIFGDERKSEKLLRSLGALQKASTFIHTEHVITPEEKPSVALRQGRESSMRLAINDVKEGNADAVVSAGNTGALMAMAKFVFKTLPGINRPAIAAMMPTRSGSDCLVLDMGANLDCDARNLFEFAVMGEAFYRAVMDKDKPTIGLLNVGSEDMKGHDYLRQAAEMLRDSDLADSFHGFIEGNDISKGTVDVVVTDGFTGNAVLKAAEGYAHFISKEVKRAFTGTFTGRLVSPLAAVAMRGVKKRFDPNMRNGGMFLGLNGVAIKSHGSATDIGFARAILVAADSVTNRVNNRIIEEIRLFDAEHDSTAPADTAPLPQDTP